MSLLCHSIPPRGIPAGPETKAILSQLQSAKQLLQAAAAVCCYSSFYAGLDDAGSSLSFWLSSSQGWGKDGSSFSYRQQELSAAEAWTGGFALTLTLLSLPAHCKNLQFAMALKTLSRKERGTQDKGRGASDICVFCSNKGVCHTTP